MRTATLFVRGNASLSSSSRFALTSWENHVSPVTFPPGRARLATNPVATGSATDGMTMGIVAVACLAATSPWCSLGHDDINLETNQLGRQFGESLVLSLSPTEFDGEVLAFDIAQIAQARPQRLYPDHGSG